MVKLKLTLKSKRPSTIYASNGKPYRLQPGSNTIELEYEDYLALAKTLGIKPAYNSKLENTKLVEKKEESTKKEEPKVEELKSELIEEHKSEEPESVKEEVTEEEVKQEEHAGNDEEAEKEVDYASMSYNKLKAEYKAITGKYCKLKKDEVIAFLQEHHSNV